MSSSSGGRDGLFYDVNILYAQGSLLFLKAETQALAAQGAMRAIARKELPVSVHLGACRSTCALPNSEDGLLRVARSMHGSELSLPQEALNKQERRQMTRTGEGGSTGIERMPEVASEEFGLVPRLAGRRVGWDPYDVWRTRVKEHFTEPEERRRSRRASEAVGARRGAWRRHVDDRLVRLLGAWRPMPVPTRSKGDLAGL